LRGKAVRASQSQVDTVKELTSELRKNNALELQKQLNEKGYVDPSVPKSNQDSYSKGSDVLTGINKDIYDAGLRVQQAMASYNKDYEARYAQLERAGGFSNPGSLPTKQSIKERRALINDFKDVNFAIRERISNFRQFYLKELNEIQIKENFKLEIVNAGEKRMQIDTLLAIRQIDENICDTSLAILSLLETSFGTWFVDQDERTYFEKTADMETYNALASEIERLCQAQEVLQRRLLNKALKNESNQSEPKTTSSPHGA